MRTKIIKGYVRKEIFILFKNWIFHFEKIPACEKSAAIVTSKSMSTDRPHKIVVR